MLHDRVRVDLAKVTRDRLMHALAGRYPNYLWDRNVGYSTPAHLQLLAAHGPCAHHRRSFMPVSQLSLDSRPAEIVDITDDPPFVGD